MAMEADRAFDEWVKGSLPRDESWGAAELGLTFAMWAVMMVGMMLPSAAPMILMFATVHRQRRERDEPHVSTAVFVAGYLLVWTLFGAVATLAQWGLHSASMTTVNKIVGGALLLAAGIYQWTPLKQACLKRCRGPLDFIMTEWREGTAGAAVMGARHGLFCVGCCWLLMALLFVAGVMNLVWVAAISAFVLIEKVVPRGQVVGLVTGSILIALGSLVLFV